MLRLPLRILHLEDNAIDADYLATLLREDGQDCEIRRAGGRSEYVALLKGGLFDLIVSDYSLPSFNGHEALRLARDLAPTTPFIFVSGTIGEEAAVESLKNGAADYVLKNRLSRFPAAVKKAVEGARQQAERAALQRELLRREELFRQITDNVDDLIAVLDCKGRRVFCSASYRRLLGDPEVLTGTDSFDDVHGDDRAAIRTAFEDTVRTGIGRRLEYRLQGRNGEVHYIESQGSVIRDASGTVVNVVVVSRDVTERRRIEARLREQAELLDKAQDAIFVRDLDQKVTYWSRGAERVYGWTSHEVTGRRLSDILYRRGQPAHQDNWNQVLDTGEWSGELQQVTKDGRDLVIVSRRTLVRDAAGRPVAVMNINSDITKSKEMETKLLRTQRLEAIGSLAGGIAHDLNNILAPILMLAEMLHEDSEDTSARNMLQTVRTSAMRGVDLVRQILSFAQGSSERPLHLQVRHLIKDMVKLMTDTFPRSISIRSEIPADLWTVQGDPTQLHQVILNLCVNARDAMQSGGQLTVSARNLDSASATEMRRIIIEVADTGSGIPQEIRDKVFQPFFTTKGPEKGTGLGLSTVASILEKHGGTIDFSSEPGKGTTFRVTLPATLDRPDEAPHKEPEVRPPAGRGERILLVDDEQAVLTMTRGVLEAYNYRVTVARDGMDALSIHRRQQGSFDLVITDTAMPGMDGPTLIRYLKRVDAGLRIIAISGLDELPSRDIDLGLVAARIRKPFEGAELLTAVANVLANSTKASG